MDKKNQIKLAVAIVSFLAAGALIAWQFMPAKGPAGPASKPPEEVVTKNAKDGSTVIKQGGRSERIPPGSK